VYWSLVSDREIVSSQVTFVLKEPETMDSSRFSPDMTVERIAAYFSGIDYDKDKKLSLAELIMFYFDLNFRDGLQVSLKRFV
jgi:hypothetical protein